MIARLAKRALLWGHAHGWLSFATIDAIFERWPRLGRA